MEREIGETFEFEGKTYVARVGEGCKYCAFENEDCCSAIRSKFIGECAPTLRADDNPVIFVEVDEEGKDKSSSIEEDSRKETKSILEEALEIVNGSRNVDYGDPVISFIKIGKIATLISGEPMTPIMCCAALMAVKIERESYKHKRDNLVDLCGYTEIMNRIIESETKE